MALVLDQGEVVLGEVGVDEPLERSLAERGVGPGDRLGDEVPAEGGRQLVGGDLAPEDPAGEVPQMALAALGFVDGPGLLAPPTCR